MSSDCQSEVIADEMIYLNNAATSHPKPEQVISAVSACLRSEPREHSRSGYESRQDDVIALCRQRLADLLGAQNPEEIVLTSGATFALNLALRGLGLDGGHVVTTALEHNSVLRPLRTMEREGLIRLSVAPCDSQGSVDLDALGRLAGYEARAVVVNHCSNVTGAVSDIREVSEIARRAGALLVIDASQSAGYLPLCVAEDCVDILVFTGHKGLWGPQGTGGLYVSPGVSLKPLIVGGTGYRSEDPFQPHGMPIHLEAGTHNLPGISGLSAGVEFILSVGREEIVRTTRALHDRIVEGLSQIDGVTLYVSSSEDNRGPICSFNIRGLPPAEAGYILENSFGIMTRTGLHCAPLIHRALGSFPAGSVRVSPSFFTSCDDAERFIDAVRLISSGIAGRMK